MMGVEISISCTGISEVSWLPLHIAAFRHRSPEWLGLVCVSDLRRFERDLGWLVRDLRHLGRDLGQLCS